jgi:hypothetical protein
MTSGSRRVENITFLLGFGFLPPPGARLRPFTFTSPYFGIT